MRSAAGAFALLLLVAEASSGTILTFDLDPLPADWGSISSDYGDHVSASSDATGSYGGSEFTPNVEVEYRTLYNGSPVWSYLSFWQDSENGFPGAANVAFPNFESGGAGEIAFTPDAGYRVVLNQFHLTWYTGNTSSIPITYYDAAGAVISSSSVSRPSSGHTTVTPALTQPGTLRLRYGSSYDHGIDDVDFVQRPARVLVVVLDDVGVDLLESYGLEEYKNVSTHPFTGLTPNIDDLAQQGVLFRNAWVSPACSVSRASMLTGRHAFRHQVLAHPDLSTSELTLAQALETELDGAMQSAAFGKWHVTRAPWVISPLTPYSPAEAGFDLFRGSPYNLSEAPSGGNYFAWYKLEATASGNTITESHEVYATTDTIDDAITWLEQEDGPALVWLAPHSPHLPAHSPPSCLYSSASGSDNKMRMLEALDRELGWLLFGVPPPTCSESELEDAHDHPSWTGVDFTNTTVILIGDNGSANGFKGAGKINRGVKSSIYEGGINTPLIVSGYGVGAAHLGAESPALVHAVDVFATALDLAGADWEGVESPQGAIDGRSLLPLLKNPDLGPGDCENDPDADRTCVRETVYTDGLMDQLVEDKAALEQRDLAIRDARYKLIREGTSDAYEFYDLDDTSQATTELDDLESDCEIDAGAPSGAATAFAALRGKLVTLTGVDDPCETP